MPFLTWENTDPKYRLVTTEYPYSEAKVAMPGLQSLALNQRLLLVE